jgi:hypothetical protein
MRLLGRASLAITAARMAIRRPAQPPGCARSPKCMGMGTAARARSTGVTAVAHKHDCGRRDTSAALRACGRGHP